MKPCLLFAVGLLAAVAAHAQPSPPWAMPAGFENNYRIISNDSLYEVHGPMAESYNFHMAAAPTCAVDYTITEFRRNGWILRLLHWKEGRSVHAEQGYLTFNSRTATFPVAAGDTISVYREFSWYHPGTHRQDTGNYLSPDTLEWVVHLVRASDGAPLAMLDSTGILPRTTPGAPCIYASLPLMGTARYIVPAAVAGDSAFIGVTVRANGGGDYYFVRTDSYTAGLSRQVTQARWIDYLRLFSGMYAKHRTDIRTAAADPAFTWDVRVAGREATATFAGPRSRMEVAIYDMAGHLLYSPYSSVTESGTARFRLEYRQPVVVTLLSNDRVVASRVIK